MPILPPIALLPVDEQNWRTALALSVDPEQQRFVADHHPIAAVILAKAYLRPGGLTWLPYAIYTGERMVGLAAVAFDPHKEEDSWVFHFFIDRAVQGQGIGRAALNALVELTRMQRPASAGISLVVHPENRFAHRLYQTAGFQPTGEERWGEPVYRLTFSS